jgi:hypothetical protein
MIPTFLTLQACGGPHYPPLLLVNHLMYLQLPPKVPGLVEAFAIC